MEPSRFGVGNPRSGPPSDPLELPSATGDRGFSCVIGRVVIFEVPLPFLRYEPQDAEMPVGHDRPSPGSMIGIDTATASGSA